MPPTDWWKVHKDKSTIGLNELEEGPETKIHLNPQRGTLKKMPNGKTPGLDGIHGF